MRFQIFFVILQQFNGLLTLYQISNQMKKILFLIAFLMLLSGCSDDLKEIVDIGIPTETEVPLDSLTGRARKYFVKAQAGDADAQYELAYCFIRGKYGAKYNKGDACYWAHKAAKQNHPGGTYLVALCREEDKEKSSEWYQRAYDLAEKGAEKGDLVSMWILGKIYENGKGDINRSRKKALSWYQKSAELGYAPSQNSLGWCYAYGEGVEKDLEEAARWYRKSAEQGEPEAQYNLGWCYESGEGVKQDQDKALYWYRKSAEQGNTDAQDLLKDLDKQSYY